MTMLIAHDGDVGIDLHDEQGNVVATIHREGDGLQTVLTSCDLETLAVAGRLRQTLADFLSYAQEPGEGDDQDDYRRILSEARAILEETKEGG